MTNEELFDDLKQFIDGRQSQLEERLGARIDGVEQSLTQRMDGLEAKMVTKQDLEATERRILQSVGDTMSQANDATDTRRDDHEKRLRRLEHRTA
jgi:hypothetical protein